MTANAQLVNSVKMTTLVADANLTPNVETATTATKVPVLLDVAAMLAAQVVTATPAPINVLIA